MFPRKFLKAQLFSVLLQYKRFDMKNILCMSFHYKHNYQKYYICHNYNTLKLLQPLDTFLKKQFSKKITFEINKDVDKENEIAVNLHEIALLLNCEDAEIVDLFKKHPQLFINFDLESTLTKVSLLLNKFDEAVIKKNIFILELPVDELENRLIEMNKWELDDSNVGKFLPLLKISSLDFYRLSAKFIVEKNIVKDKNRIIFIANEMQCAIEDVVQKCLEFQALLFRNFREIENDIKVLKEFEITPEKFLREFSVLNVASPKLRRRLKKLTECGLRNNLSLVQSSEKTFAKKVKKELEKIKILNSWPSAEEYISHTLKLTTEEMMDLKLAFPQIFKMDIVKLRDILEFLLSCGYTTKQISLFPFVFNYSYLKIRERYGELKSFGITLPKISLLCVNQKYYDKLIERLKINTSEIFSTGKDITSRMEQQSKKKPSH